ncbi:hypothetical protein GTQ40_05755 [Flavobacteriaceae bacterium R38]|nr:hypothetical protein [Flavobacteriaceae bacterium R38]
MKKLIQKVNRHLTHSIFLTLCFACGSSSDDITDGENPMERDFNLILTLETEQDQIGDLSNNAMAIFNGVVWSVGGNRSGVRDNITDIWRSDNAVAWESVSFNAFSRRTDHTLTNYDNKLWVIGGRDNTGDTLGEVWSSEDGTSWDLITETPAFTGAVNHDVVVFNNRLYLISRNIEDPDKTSVWSSANGEDWELEADNAFSGRDEFKAVVFNNIIYVLGGFDPAVGVLTMTNEIWTSTDGATWSQLEPSSIFQPRYGHTATVYNDKVFVAGGLGREGSSLAIQGNLWYSEDMINWFEYEPFRSDTGILEHSALTFDGKLWLFFGIEAETGAILDGDVSGKIFSILEE